MGKASTTYFHAMDPELPFIAASAALEVDNFIKGRGGSIEYLNRLSQLLRASAPHETHLSSRFQGAMDPVSAAVFQRALSISHKSPDVRMEDLAEKVNEVAAKLELESASTPTEKLEILKAFCLEISRHSLATSFSIQDTSPENPYQEYGP